jgi:hypothetical protein
MTNRATEWASGMVRRLKAKGYIKTTPCDLMFRARRYAERNTKAPTGPLEQHWVEPHRFNDRYMLRLHERADWQGTHPDLVTFARKLFLQTRRDGFPIYVHTAYRSPDLQRTLFMQGHSQIKDDGPHQRGCALDIVHAHFHWRAAPEFWAYMGRVGQKIAKQNGLKLTWGGNWKGLPDPAHWQVTRWRDYPVIDPPGHRIERSPYSKQHLQMTNEEVIEWHLERNKHLL